MITKRAGRPAAFLVVLGMACSSGNGDPARSGPAASAARSSLSLSAGSVAADGVTPATIVVSVRDEAGSPIAGAIVALGYTGSASLPTPVATGTDGTAVLQMTASEPTAGDVTATVSTGAPVVVGGAPQLTFHDCPDGTFLDGACVPPPFVRLPPAKEVGWAGVGPMGFAVGDLDGNGLTDVVVPDQAGGALDVLLASGGKLVHAGRHDAGTSVYGAAVADFTGDAIADVVTMGHSRGLLVFPGRGDGSLGAAIASPVSYTGAVVGAADLDGDRDVDVIISVADGVGVMANEGDATFGSLTKFTGTGLSPTQGVSYVPTAVAIADLNGDGAPDAVSAYQHADAAVVQLGNGDGTFATPTSFATGDAPRALAVVDVDGDGHPDVVTANYGSTASNLARTVSVLLGGGDGSLGSQAEFVTGPNPVSIAAGDLDGDGRGDVVTADSNGRSASVLFGTASGALEFPVAYETPAIPRAVAIAVLDGDALPDLAVLDGSTGTVSALLGRGGRGFAGTIMPPPLDLTLFEIASGDVDGDGHVDVVAAMFAQEIALVRGRGDGSFVAPVRVAVPGDASGGRGVATGDLDGDGRADVIVLETNENRVSLLRGDAGGGLGAATTYPVGKGPAAAAVGDLDGDGRADLVVADGAWDGGTVSVLLGQEGGTLAAAVPFPAGSFPRAIALGDVDRDGDLDAVVGGIWPWELRVLRGDGEGGFAAPVAYPAGGSVSESGVPQDIGIALADLDGDLDLDAAATDQAGNAVGVFVGAGDGSFAPRATYGVGTRPRSLASGDVDGDGRLDLVTADTNGTLTFLRGDGDGAFSAGVSIAAGFSPPGPAFLADMDGDAYRDVVVPLSGRFRVFRGSAAGLEGWTPIPMGARPSRLQTADLDRDGRADLVTASYETHTMAVALGVGDGTFGPSRLYDVAGYPVRFALADVNADEVLDLVVTHTTPFTSPQGQIGVLLGNGDGTFGAEITSPAGVAASALALGDVTGDGKLDVVVGGTESARLLAGSGTGAFGPPVALPTPASSSEPPPGSSPSCDDVALADVNGDTKLDLLVVTSRNLGTWSEVGILPGNGDGTFRAGSSHPAQQAVWLALGDLDGDGDRDVAAASNTPTLTVLLADGTGGFEEEMRRLPATGLAIRTGDLDGDGDLDLVTAGMGSIGAHRNDGAASFTSASFLPPAQVKDLAVADLDGDGRVDVAALTDAGVCALMSRAP